MQIQPTLFVALLLVLGGCSHGSAPATRHTTARRASRTSSARASQSGDEAPPPVVHRIASADAPEPVDPTLPSAEDQSDEPADLEITRQIRFAVVTDGSLSWGARNVVIITQSAVVTLRGDVGTELERRAIDAHAHATAGVTRVDNQLRLVP